MDELSLSAAKPLCPPASHQSLLQDLSDLHTNLSFACWLCVHAHMGMFRKKVNGPSVYEKGAAAFTVTRPCLYGVVLLIASLEIVMNI